jgi:hypothetical protein
MYAIHWGSFRICFFRGDSGNHFGADPEKKLFLQARHTDDPVISAILPMIFNDDHPLMTECTDILPEEAYFYSFSALGDEMQAFILQRAHYAMNAYLQDKRMSKVKLPLTFVSRNNLSLMFGKCSRLCKFPFCFRY